jgi:hypothetical protein
MPKPSLLLPFLFITQLATAQSQLLFKVSQHGKTGYINNKGTMVIPAIYHNGFEFAEGLAAVRENGLYGFIDSSGKYAIAPQFDYATYFVNGVTLVYKERRSYFIDKTGKVILPPVYESMKFITGRKAVITTKTGKTGIIDIRTGRLLLDTLYGLISDFDKGVGVIGQYDSSRIYYSRQPQAVIDTTGNFIVPFGKFDYIHDYHGGYANVSIDTNGTDGVIDVTGRLLKGITTINNWDPINPLPGGYSIINQRTAGDQGYEGLINIHGDTILNDPNYRGVTGFSCGRIIVIDHSSHYFILDRHGKRISDQPFEYIDKFIKNYAIVKTTMGYGIIDTNARFVIQPQYEVIRFPDSTVDYFFFGVPHDKEKYGHKFGVANLKNQVIIPPVLQYEEEKGFVNGLLKATVDNRETWFNEQGKMVWQEPDETNQIKRSVNIDYINYSSYRVSTEPEDSIRWASSSPGYKKITAANRFNNNEFIFQIDTSKPDTLWQQYYAWKLIVGNSTKDTINLLSIGGLALQLEALDEDGEWKKIEYIGFPTHTNGYRITQLAPGTYWPLTIPRFDGSFTTKIRAALWYLDKNEKKQIIYSNAITASINKTQFWRNWFYPEGVYDPHWYNDRIVDMSTVEKDNWGESFGDYKP